MDVLALQTKLKAAGFDPGPLDGINGPRTEFALDAALAVARGYVACDIDADLRKGLAVDLERDEGRIPHAYQDHLGYWTIGIGRLIDKRKGGKLSNDEIDYLLDNDIRAGIESVANLPAWQAVKGDPVRARGLLNMRFQLGLAGLLGFRNSLALIAAKDWHAAAMNLRASTWAKQTPERAERVIRMIETGRA
jgi:lysozyme